MKKLLNLLMAGAIAIAIALGGTSLGIALKKVGTNSNTSNIKAGILGLYGGFKTLTNTKLKLAKQEILGIEVGNANENNDKATTIKAADEELEILDLSKTIGNMEWILKQLKYPNPYSGSTSFDTLIQIEYEQEIQFNIESKNKNVFNVKKIGVFLVVAGAKNMLAVKRDKITKEILINWNLNLWFNLKVGSDTSSAETGVITTTAEAIEKSTMFQKTLVAAGAFAKRNFKILLWKKGAIAKTDASDADLAIMLNRRTGKVFIWTRENTIIAKLSVNSIAKPTTTLM